MIYGVTMRNMSFARVENTNSVRVTFQLMIEENGTWRDATRFGDMWFKYYSSLKENPADGLGSDWMVQDTQHFTAANIGNHRTGTPTASGGEGYWYTYEWTSTPDADHAKVLKAQCSATCEFPSTDPNYWEMVTGVSGRITSPAEADAQAAAAATPPTPTSPSASLSSGHTWIDAGCTVPSGSATYAEVWRSVDNGAFAIVSDNQKFASATSVSYRDYNVSIGHSYKYKFLLRNRYGTEGPFSDETSAVDMPPAGLSGSVTARRVSLSSGSGDIELTWKVAGVTGSKVKVEWSDLANFSSITGTDEIDFPGEIITVRNLAAAKTWYFRVHVYIDNNRKSGYYYASCALTQAPTCTVSPLLNAYKNTDSVTVSWQHTSEDGAPQDAYEVRVTVGGSSTTSSGTTDTSKTISLSSYSDGTNVGVAVRTHSVGGYSAWAEVPTFTVYAPPSVSFTMSDYNGDPVDSSHPLTTLPLNITTESATYTTGNKPIWWHLLISAGESYTSVSPDGTERYISEGEVLLDWSISNGDPGFSQDGLSVSVGATAFRFEQAKTYRVQLELSTQAGLRNESNVASFTASLSASVPRPNAVLSWDADAMAVDITPVCCYYDEIGEQTVYVDGVTLAVYRVASDGDVHLVADNLANDGIAGCRDAHADLGASTYRIVATHTATGIQAALDRTVDTPFPMAVVLWDESTMFYNEYGEAMPYMGRALMGIYNGLPSESYAKDTSYREHAGADHPIAKRGTQRGHKLSLGFDMEASTGDADLLRALEAYDGDCYVRIPGFPGFPADARVNSIGKSYESPSKFSATVEFTHVMDDVMESNVLTGGVVVNS